MNYAEKAMQALLDNYPGDVPEGGLTELYTLLVLVKGEDVTLEDVHDAWSVWTNSNVEWHRSLVPFEELSEYTQGLDQPYATAIIEAARALRQARG